MKTQIEIAADLINLCAYYLNHAQHIKASETLMAFDSQMNNVPLPREIIFKRISFEAELCLRTGDYARGIKAINRQLAIFSEDSDEKFHLLIYLGKLEKVLAAEFNLNALCDALKVAENLNRNDLIAIAYSELATSFAIRYPGLGIYFNRKAETHYQKQGDEHHRKIESVKRALSSFYLYDRSPSAKTMRLKTEAERIVNSTDYADFNQWELLYFQRVKGTVLCDENIILDTLNKYDKKQSLPEVCRLESLYMGICINKQLYDKALNLLPRYKEDAIQLHGDKVRHQLDILESLLSSKTDFKYENPYEYKKPGDSTTLLDILDHYSLGEELWALAPGIMRSLFPTYQHEGMFETLVWPDGTVKLIPCSLAVNDYYRGQSAYFDPCKPSLFRKDVTESRRFIERLKYIEFTHLIASYPIVSIFQNDVTIHYPDGTDKPVSLSVDALALAQHYGIWTELIDVTCDKFVAAFFACTTCVDGVYSYIKEKRQREGVFYHYAHRDFFGKDEFKLRTVGLQPFSRPGEQKGFVLEMDKDEDFNKMVVEKIPFTHDPKVAEFIFNYTNRSKKLFPSSILEEKAAIIVNSYTFSQQAYKEAKELFYPDTDDKILQDYLKEQNKSLVDRPSISFTEEERQQCIKEWKSGGEKKMFDQIFVRFAFTKDSEEKK